MILSGLDLIEAVLMPTPKSEMNLPLIRKIERQFQWFSSLTDNGSWEISEPTVSGWSVSQHMDHILKAAQRILSLIGKNEQSATKKGNLFGKIILLIGIIPRGRKSPKVVEGEQKSKEELIDSLNCVSKLLNELKPEYLETSNFDHHVFGGLNGRDWLRFMFIHNNHHIKIIRKILNA